MNNLYALFVGINNYSNIRPLTGCENDVERMHAFFKKYVEGSFQFHPKTLLSSGATKSGIVKAFQEQLIRTDLKSGDVLLLYFSGHGAEEDANEVFWHSEPNKKLQVLACYDSDLRTGKNFLADKELRYLLHQAAKPNVELVTIFDCCHSGDNTRAIPPSDIIERLAGQVPQRKWSDFIFGKEISPQDIAEKTLGKALPQGRHVQLAACDSHESAYERTGVGGFFTSSLLEALNQSKGDICYMDLKNRVKNAIRGIELSKHSKPQTPQIYAYSGQDEATMFDSGQVAENALFKSFLGGAIKDKPLDSQVYFNQQEQRWEVDKGAVYGVKEQWEGIPQQVTVPTSEHDVSVATVKKVFPGFSEIEFEPYAGINTNERYSSASIPSLMSRTLSFSVTGEQAGVALFQQFSPPGPLLNDGLRLVEPTQSPEYNVLASGGKYLITLPNDERPLTKQTNSTGQDDVQEVLGYLKKIRHWAFVKNLRNEQVAFPAEAFDIKILQNGQPVAPTGNDFTLQPSSKMKLLVANKTKEDLYYGLVYLDSLFGIVSGLLPGKVKLIEASNKFESPEWPVNLEAFIQTFNWKAEQFHILIIAAASEFSLDLFDQESLEAPKKGIDFWANRGINLRGGMLNPEDWQTRLLTFVMPNPDYQP